MRQNMDWRKIRFVVRYLIMVILVGFFVVPLALGFSFLLGAPVPALALIALGGWAAGTMIARYCPKPDNLWLRYGPPGVLILAPILCAIAIMAISDGGSDGPWIVPVLLSPGFFPGMFIEIFDGTPGLPLSPLAPSLYAIAYGVGFFRQEWSQGDPFKIMRKAAWAGSVLVVCLAVSGAGMMVRRSETFVPRGHGFAYERGFSSTDLAPYRLNNPDNILPVLSGPSSFHIDDKNKMPVLDGAEAAFPLYAAFAKACYGDLTPKAGEKGAGLDPYRGVVTFTNTINAFERLARGHADIVFGAEPSAEQKELAVRMGQKLVLTPIAQEAFVFFVNDKNPVQGLSAEQIRAIYKGDVKNWKNLGGDDARIMAFQRPVGSGSQTIMLRFMKDETLMRPLKEEYAADMGGVLEKTASYYNAPNAIGYSFRFFVEGMARNRGVRLLALDGVSPTPENIQSGAYPFVLPLYAITLENDKKPEIAAFLKWMQGPEGQELVKKVGYSPLAQ